MNQQHTDFPSYKNIMFPYKHSDIKTKDDDSVWLVFVFCMFNVFLKILINNLKNMDVTIIALL